MMIHFHLNLASYRQPKRFVRLTWLLRPPRGNP
jgi:hypothetical protein